jgi:cytosine/adenosine deaminase-related metal-dependent hydrolase
MYKARVPIKVGSDSSGQLRGTAYGLGVHIEMYQLLHKIGISSLDILKGAISQTADVFDFDDRGWISAGKKTDFVLIEGDVMPFSLMNTLLVFQFVGFGEMVSLLLDSGVELFRPRVWKNLHGVTFL